ncbi:hypothetical protein NQZ68_017290 [Dissostichus eleginoides]|nr:hypothetical protein NQZ68_017290 [Dissostichus eleginoides]
MFTASPPPAQIGHQPIAFIPEVWGCLLSGTTMEGQSVFLCSSPPNGPTGWQESTTEKWALSSGYTGDHYGFWEKS